MNSTWNSAATGCFASRMTAMPEERKTCDHEELASTNAPEPMMPVSSGEAATGAAFKAIPGAAIGAGTASLRISMN